ncbi:MAG: CHAT domain-containing protein [Deltaproteobacteria bacterium]|nr:CHAT domain-containing protein [Deltaproteobacteria bacterium]
MSGAGRWLVLVGAWLGIVACGTTRPAVDEAAGPPEADVVIARFEDASDTDAGRAMAVALRYELAERLAWAKGIAFVAPIEAEGRDPASGPETDAVVRGRWTGAVLELEITSPAGAVIARERVAPDRLGTAAERVARALGLRLDPVGLALPGPADRLATGAALAAIEGARESGRPPTPERFAGLPDDAWGRWLQGLAAVFAGDGAGARLALDEAVARAPGLLGARYARAHTDMGELDRVRVLGDLVAASPRLPLFVDTMRTAVVDGIRQRVERAYLESLVFLGRAPSDDERAALGAIATLWALGERLPLDPVTRAELLFDVTQCELLIGDAATAERHLAELRALAVRHERDNLVPALGALVRQALGRQARSSQPVAFWEVRDYGAPEVMDLGARDCTGASALIVAAERGEAAIVRALLARGADPLAANLRGQTALHRAAWYGQGDVMRALLAHRAAPLPLVEAMDDHGRTPLMLAVEGDQPEAAALLVAAGASTHPVDRAGASALVIAGRLGRARLVPVLAGAGASFDARDREGRSALEHAIIQGHGATLEALVAAGAKVEVSHLELAARSGRVDIVDRLLASSDKSDGGGPPLLPVLRAALAADDVAMVDHLVARGAAPPEGHSLLELAVTLGANRFVAARLTPEARKARGRFGLRLVELALVQTEPDYEVIELLAEADDVPALAWLGDPRLMPALDKDPDAVKRLGPDGLGAIHHAARSGHTEIVELLIARGAPPGLAAAPTIAYAPEIAGWTPLHFAFAIARPDMVVLLLTKGARLDAVDARGRMAGQLVHLPWVEEERFERIAEAKVFIASQEGAEAVSELEQDDVISAPRPRLVLGSAYIPGPDEAGGRGPSAATDGGGFGFGGRGIQLPIRIADTSILMRADVDGQSDGALGSAGLEGVLLQCYNHAAWPEARRVARDLVRARDDEGASAMVKGLAHQNLAVIEARNGDLAAAAPHFTIASAAFDKADVAPHVAVRAAILENRSELAWRAERWQEAIDDLKGAIALRERFDQDPKLLPIPWLILGTVYSEWGRYKDAVDATTKGLSFAEVSWGKDHHVALLARGNLAVLLDALGDRKRARELFLAQVALLEGKGADADPVQLAVARANVAMFLARDGDMPAAAAAVTKAIDGLGRHDRHHFLLGRILLVAGDIAASSDDAVAEAAYRQAIDRLSAAYGPRTGVVAGAMRRLAMVVGRARADEGAALLMDAWVIASEADSPEERWPIEVELGRVAAAQGRMPTAIFFGKQAVATLERIRGDARGLGATLERSLVESRIGVWQLLADWLIGERRFEEATRVLALLKDDEERSLVTRGREQQSAGQGVPRTPTEAKIKAAAEAQADELARAGSELAELAALKRTKGLDAQGEKRLATARDRVKEARRRFEKFLAEIEAELKQMDADRAAEVGAMNLRDVSSLQGTLQELGHGAVVIHYVVVDDKLRIMLTTPTVQIGRAASVTARELNALVFRFRQALADPRSDPRPLAQELFTVLIAPIEDDLRQAKAETLMVALDGTLRYIPLAALWDGERWLVERYRVALFSRAGLDKLTTKPTAAARVAGLGVGKKIEGHSQLKEVPRELEGIVRRDASDPDGVLPGALWMDDAFGHDTLGELLETRSYSAIHIASHFVFEPGTESESYLLLGDGGKLTLEDIRYELRFDGVDLLSLSACNTAVGGEGGAGREIEGFAALTQRLGARGVLATLWPVADKSTGELMRALYMIVGGGTGGVTKADALRQAQLRFIRGKDTLDPADLVPRGPRPLVAPAEGGSPPSPAPAPTPAPVDRTHPYYWAPFVLIGNWL